MLYHGFYVKTTPVKGIQREQKDGIVTECKGFQIEIFSDPSEKIPIDKLTAAVGFEIISLSFQETEQFAKDIIDSEEKEYRRMLFLPD